MLNAAQRRAVEHVDGPLLVLAGPGSGKTRVVVHRIARLLERGVPATSVLAATFTNKAAREMRERVKGLVGAAARGLTVTTIHAACVRILREEIAALGYGRNFSIYDEAAQQSLLRAILRDMAGAGATRSASAVLHDISLAKAGMAHPVAPGPGQEEDEGAPQARAAFLAGARERYQDELRARNAVDFDDIIGLTARLLREHADARARWQQRFEHVLVDEYQDTNAPQDEVLQLLCAGHRNLCVVGDDDQSIYGWRGAEVEHILRFPERYPDAEVVKLEVNYRSTTSVVALANAVVEKSARRHDKHVRAAREEGDLPSLAELEDDEEEASFIAHEIASSIDEGANRFKEGARFAVLLRTNEQARPIEQALRQVRMPYRVLGGRSFFDRKEVLDVIAYLRVASNPKDDEAFFRVVNTPSRGVGAAALQAVADEARARGVSAFEQARDVADGRAGAGASKALLGLRDFVEACSATAEAARRRDPLLVDDLLKRIGYRDEIDKTYRDENVRAARWNLAQEVQRAWTAHQQAGEKADLAGFLDTIVLRDHDDGEEKGDGGVTLATIHAAKGLEFETVFLAGVEDGILPHARSLEDPRSLEEERRLLYVAVTRAKDRLVLTRALSRQMRGRTRKSVLSRFVEELSPDVLPREDAAAPTTETRAASNVARLRTVLRDAK